MTTAPIYSFTDTWNNAGITFSAILVDVTDTASASDSALIDLQVGSASQFSVTKAGEVICKGLTSSQNIDLQGNRLVMDADNDTYLEASTDDRLDVVVGGSLVARFDANATDTFQLDGVGFSPTGAVVGQALGFPNSTTTLEPYTPAGGGDLLAALNLSDVNDAAASKTNLRVSVDTISDLEALNGADLTDGELIAVAGYASAGDGGARVVVYDSGSSATDDGVTVFTPADSTGRFLHQGQVTPEHAGAFTGASDNRVALQRLADANVSCDFRGESYSVTTLNGANVYSILLPADFNAVWSNGTINGAGLADLSEVVRGTGADWESALTLTANATADDQSVQMSNANAATLSGGDIIVIASSELWNADSNNVASEYQFVSSIDVDTPVAGTSTVNLRQPLRDSYTTANGAYVRRFASALSPTFLNMKFIGKGGATSTQTAVRLFNPIKAKFRGVTSDGCRRTGIELNWDMFTDADDTVVNGADETGVGYGITVLGGWGGRYGKVNGNQTRHLWTGNAAGSPSGGPSYTLLREFRVGHCHGVDSLGSIIDTHAGCVDGEFDGASGSMRSGTSQEAVTMEGARCTIGSVNISGCPQTGLNIQTNGCGDDNRPNFIRFGSVSITSEGSSTSFAVLAQNKGTDTLDSFVIERLESDYSRGVRLEPENGDIRLAVIGGTRAFQRANTTTSAVEILDSATTRVHRVVLRDLELGGSFTGSHYPIYVATTAYYDNNRSAAGALEFTTIVDAYNCRLANEADEIAVRVRDSLVRLWNCDIDCAGTTGDMFLRDSTTGATCPVATVSIDGNAAMDREIDASGNIQVLPNATVHVEGNGSLADTLITILLPDDIYGTGSAFSVTSLNAAAMSLKLHPRSGHSITIFHESSTTQGRVVCPAGENLVLDGENEFAVLEYNSDRKQWVVTATNAASKAIVTDGSAAAPSVTNDGDTDTGLFFPAADNVAFSVGGSEAFRSDSSGNILVGKTSSAIAKLDVQQNTATTRIINLSSPNDTGAPSLSLLPSANTMAFQADSGTTIDFQADNGVSGRLRLAPTGVFVFNGSTQLAQFSTSGLDLKTGYPLLYNGTQVVGPQQSAIADLSVTFSANPPSAADGSITIADGSAPTNDELLEYCAENDAKIDAILSALRAHGLIAT